MKKKSVTELVNLYSYAVSKTVEKKINHYYQSSKLNNLVNIFYKHAHAIKFDQNFIDRLIGDIKNAIRENKDKISNMTEKSDPITILSKEYSYSDVKPSFRHEISKEKLKELWEKEKDIIEEQVTSKKSESFNKEIKENEDEFSKFFEAYSADRCVVRFIIKIYGAEKDVKNYASVYRKIVYRDGGSIHLGIFSNKALDILEQSNNEIIEFLESLSVHELVHAVQRKSEHIIPSAIFSDIKNPITKKFMDKFPLEYKKLKNILHSNLITEQEAKLTEVRQQLISKLNKGIISEMLLNKISSKYYYDANFGKFVQDILKLCPAFNYALEYIEKADPKEIRKIVKEEFGLSKKQYPIKHKMFNKFINLGSKFVEEKNDDIIKKMIEIYDADDTDQWISATPIIEKIKKTNPIPKIETLLSSSISAMETSASKTINIDRLIKNVKEFVLKHGGEKTNPIEIEKLPDYFLQNEELKKYIKYNEDCKYLSFNFSKEKNTIHIVFHADDSNKTIIDIVQFNIY